MSRERDPRDPPVGPPADRVDPARQLLQRLRGRAGRRRERGYDSGAVRRRPEPAGYSGPGPDDRDPQPLTTALSELVAERGWERGTHGGSLFARWPELVGPEIAGHAHPESLADGVLTVRADSTAWATQLRLLAPDLVRRLAEGLGGGAEPVAGGTAGPRGEPLVTEVVVVGPTAPSWRRGPRTVKGRGPRDTYG